MKTLISKLMEAIIYFVALMTIYSILWISLFGGYIHIKYQSPFNDPTKVQSKEYHYQKP